MPLDGARLTGALFSDIKAQMDALFPINADLLDDEKALAEEGREKFCHAIANAAGPDVVDEIVTNAVVPSGIAGQVTTGVALGDSTVTTAPGTVT